MTEPILSGFIPKWLRNPTVLVADDVPIEAGGIQDADPRIHTRLIPKDHGYSLSSRALVKILDLQQNLILYAARDVAEGLNADFADLRSLREPMVKFATMTIEPFETGSFVIPSRFEAAAHVFEQGGDEVTTDQVIERFSELLRSVDHPNAAASISIGALLACQELGKLLRREVDSIEWVTVDRQHGRKPPCVFTSAKAEKVDRLLEKRRSTDQRLERVKGRLTSFDTLTWKFQLTVDGQKSRLRGTVNPSHVSWMCNRLGSIVELEGMVERRGSRIHHVSVISVVEGQDE